MVIIMPVVDVINKEGVQVSTRELSDAIFNVKVNPAVLNQVVTMQLARKREGTASVKRRSEIRGSTKKLFRQKGTGRARRGDIKSPLLRGGGVVFGPKPRNYDFKIPKKVRKLALKMALSSRLQDESLTVLDKLEFERIKTRDFVDFLKGINKENALIITDKKDNNLELSSRNVENVKVLRTEGLNVYDILKYNDVILLEDALASIEGRLS